MKIFKRKKIEVQHQLLDDFGWGSYDDIPDDFDSDSWIPQDTVHFKSPSFRQRVARSGQEKLNRFWFKNWLVILLEAFLISAMVILVVLLKREGTNLGLINFLITFGCCFNLASTWLNTQLWMELPIATIRSIMG